MNTPIPFRKSDQFLNRLRSVKNIEKLKNLAKEIGNYVSINKNDREKFTYDKFFNKLDDFLINLESLSAIKGTDFVLEDLILYIKAQKEIEENKIYKNILEIGKEVLEKEFDNFNIFFQMSTDEDIMTMVIDIRDRQTPLKDLIPLKKSISKEIREAVKKQMKKVPLFAIRVDVPILKDNLQEEAVAT